MRRFIEITALELGFQKLEGAKKQIDNFVFADMGTQSSITLPTASINPKEL